MTGNENVVFSFYEAFSERNAEAMVRWYADDVIFHDPVFGELHGERVRDMWRMLIARATDLRIEVSGVRSCDPPGTVTAHWEAWYTFTATGRKVHNVIDASFVVDRDRSDVEITRHTDRFSLWRWSRMALGMTGVLLGWTPLVQNKIRATAARGLDAYVKGRP